MGRKKCSKDGNGVKGEDVESSVWLKQDGEKTRRKVNCGFAKLTERGLVVCGIVERWSEKGK